MQFLDLTLPSAAENLALDEALLVEAETGRGGETLRVWEWPQLAVVLGSGGKLADDVDDERCRADGVPILRRSSGGGTVLLGRGCLLYSVVLRYDRDSALTNITSSIGYILDRVQRALTGLVPEIVTAGTSDLTVDGRKFSGNAQQRKARHFLHHGTLLYAFDLALVGRYLKTPARQPKYRDGRPHDEFVRNLPADAADLRRRLRTVWEATETTATWPAERVRQLMEERYSLADWHRRR
jgi:lipoate-protein ligase A